MLLFNGERMNTFGSLTVSGFSLYFCSALCYVFPSTGFGLGLFLGCYIRLLIRCVSILIDVNFHISTASALLHRSSVLVFVLL